MACFLVVTGAGLIPESHTSAEVDRFLGPAARVTGVQQNWGVFSPNPMQVEANTHALVYFEDGTFREWRPRPNGLFDSSRSERWRKWESRVRLDINEAHWPIAAQFIADEFADEPSPVASVRLVRTWSEVPLPSIPNGERQIFEFHFFEWDSVNSAGEVLAASDQLSSEISS